MVEVAPQAHAKGVTHVPLESLLALAEKAHRLSLRHSRIRSRKTDAYRSTFKGRGMEYDESRLYTPGDDMRHLDWRLMARAGEAYTKLFCEERERPVYFGVDFTPTMFFSTQQAFKSVAASNIAALLAWGAMHEGDRVGGVLFNEQSHVEMKPQRGKRGVLHLLHHLVNFSTANGAGKASTKGHAVDAALLRLSHLIRPGSLVFLISDFRHIDKHEILLRSLSSHSELVLIHIYDPLEKELPPPGEYAVSDGQSSLYINSANKALAKQYAEQFQKRHTYLKRLAKKMGHGLVEYVTSDNVFETLQSHFGVR
ncbi:MAG: DUF58 domain-containing protein [Candidatus Oxydemutatoraceae bacterium WSBS_2016_MAG_OTU14]